MMSQHPHFEFDDDFVPLVEGVDRIPAGAFDLVEIDPAAFDPLLVQLRRRVWGRRIRGGVALAAAFLVGLFVPYLAGSGSGEAGPSGSVAFEQPEGVKPDAAPADGSTEPASGRAADVDEEGDPTAREESETLDPDLLRRRVAGASPVDQRRLLRVAGDIYLDRYDDVRAAVHCYQQVLELEDAFDLTFAQEDESWLLANLRLGREPLFAGESNQ